MTKRIISSSLLLSIFTSISYFYIIKPSYSFIPKIYEPNKKELKSTGESIAKTAAQLLYFGELERANQLTNLAIKLNSKDDRIWALLAEIQIRKNELKSSKESLAKAQKLNPNNATYYFKEAAIDFELNKIDRSIKLIKKGLSIDPQNAEGYFQLGNSRIVKNKLRPALLAFEEANKIKPTFWQSLNNQALVLYELHEINKAILIWEKVLKIEPDAEPILALAAAKYKTNMKNDLSIEFAKKALLKKPNYVNEHYQKEQLWGKKLRMAAKKLLNDPRLQEAVANAITHSTLKNGL